MIDDRKPRAWWSLCVFLLLVAATASLGAMFTPGAWYGTLVKPSWTPPSWLFAPVWTVLYVMIAMAGWLVWRAGERGPALAFWGSGLALNAAWSWLFFAQHWIGAALIDIVSLWVTIGGFVVAARSISGWASLLFLPYLAWVTFAMALNIAIWRLNG